MSTNKVTSKNNSIHYVKIDCLNTLAAYCQIGQVEPLKLNWLPALTRRQLKQHLRSTSALAQFFRNQLTNSYIIGLWYLAEAFGTKPNKHLICLRYSHDEEQYMVTGLNDKEPGQPRGAVDHIDSIYDEFRCFDQLTVIIPEKLILTTPYYDKFVKVFEKSQESSVIDVVRILP